MDSSLALFGESQGVEGAVQLVSTLFNDLSQLLKGVLLLREASPRTLDLIASFGERLCATVVSCVLGARLSTRVEYLDSRTVVRTDHSYGSAVVDFAATNSMIRDYFHARSGTGKHVQVVTGFIGSTSNGETTTLGRGGSDYTASIFGAALNASEVQIWTDVDGVLTADPRRVKNALLIQSMSYEEAMEMSYFGAKVIYPPTMGPAMERGIPLRIKNTFNPGCEGTLVCSSPAKSTHGIRGISSIPDISLLNLQGSGMVGVAGVAQRLFACLARQSISVILITQASSEHSICFAVTPDVSERAREVVEREFELEIMKHQVDGVSEEGNLSIIAAVGEGMRHTANVCGRLFGVLGRGMVNIKAIAQGSSELNVSFVVSRDDLDKSMRLIHERFFQPNHSTVSLFIAGVGLIGSTLLEQIKDEVESLHRGESIDLRVVGLANTRHMLIEEKGIPPSEYRRLLEQGRKADTRQFVTEMTKALAPNPVFVDCTSSEQIPEMYPQILSSGIHIVAANKKANSGPSSLYRRIHESARASGKQFLYETNVGAGLPVVGTLQSLLLSGDRLIKIEGVLSGTLSYLFNSFTPDKKFSDTVVQARLKGLTEPDPRDDLNGMDVARKILILAREAGLDLELSDVEVESLVPPSCREQKSAEDFLLALKGEDQAFASRLQQANGKGKALRYIASLEHGKARVSLQEVDSQHASHSLSESENIVIFTTKRYHRCPLVIKGPGAGAEVTAGGVLSDILRIVKMSE